ncbi:NAD(P)-dependent oxidoreductase [Microbacterium sp.]|uniref:NAD-dependent epimerase/dehydratase family protein n=1 Tax=Microbacterium sp. TaxID=51671 RepID=UPI001AC94D4B|nr:NAD(P)-dependent oxidoreductase [Microbacterium sp.]MBN9155866.1 NAD(P)-dependent oxidoreductase [Microbacterium sp.]MBS1899617.1 NAD(P)-dependent oxidoreductase [Actinomycetota bacterium]
MSASARPVLVTGAGGFLGGYVVRELRAHGIPVLASGRDAQALARVAAPEETLVSALAGLPGAVRPVDAIVHCAALSSPWGRRSDFAAANVEGTAAAVSFAEKSGARRFVFVSSPSVYAAARDRIGIREDEVDPGNRLNDYIRSKLAAEELLREAQRAGRIHELVIVRPRGLIGAGDPSLVPRLIAVHRRIGVPLFDDGRNLIDVTAVENAASALRLALRAGDPAGGVYNISNGDPRPFRELLEGLLSRLGETPRFRRLSRRGAWTLAASLEGICRALPGRPEPPLTRYTLSTIAYAQTLDISRARSELGYAPVVSLDEALDRAVADLCARAERAA